LVRRNPVLSAFMAARPAFCGGCRLERDCQGGCKAAAEVCAGDLSACDPFLAINRDAARPLPPGREESPASKDHSVS
jgi:MoaA/NifB/PqqE/SkfB family radical SAM enzyme